MRKRENMALEQISATQIQATQIGLTHWLAVGAGAALGAWLRWGLGIAFNASIFPLATLIANLSGGLLIGMATAYFMGVSNHNELRLFVITGFLGGFTTFSAFSAEAFSFLQKQQYAWAAVHISSHVIGSLLMTAVGFALIYNFRH